MDCWRDITIIFYKYCLCCLGVNSPEPNFNNPNCGIMRDQSEDALFNDMDKTATEKTIITPYKDVVYSQC